MTTGHERDAETGLDYRGARFYDSDVARFLSLDPLAAEFPAWSDYNYVLGNPVMFIDPDGKAPEDIYLDEDGNYLGEDGAKTNDVRVINKNTWNATGIGGGDKNRHSTVGTETLQQSSKKLVEYDKGISISEGTWNKIEKSGGSELTPFVENNSNGTVYYKPEGLNGDGINLNPHVDESGAYPIAPNTDLYSPVDGVRTTQTPEGQVFKVTTGASVQIDENGTPDMDYYGVGNIFTSTTAAGNQVRPEGNWEALTNSQPTNN